MSSKPKALLKHAKSKKKKEQVLDDADDYLAVAVDNEDAMGKHRAGDAPKSLRFARRAIELYTQGLARWPRNVDLAYNKARLELEIATHPILMKQLDVPVFDLLRQSLASHQYAIGLDPDNADAYFNHAQVLTAIAEHMAKDDSASENDALELLERAVEYQGKCLLLQEARFAESKRAREEADRQALDTDEDHEDGGARIGINNTGDREEDEQWVSVVEPVTADTLVDTVLAQLSTLTALCSIVNSIAALDTASSPVSLAWIEACSNKLLDDLLPNITNANTDILFPRKAEILLTTAIFKANFLELAFRFKAVNNEMYKNELEKAYTVPDLHTQSSANVLVEYARALIAFNAALADAGQALADDDSLSHSSIRWNALSKVQKLLTSAANLSSTQTDIEVLATTHMLRGDSSLLLFGLSYPPTSFAQAISNATQLLKNAEVFYRNANKLFGSLGRDGQKEREVAAFRGGVTEVLRRIDSSSIIVDVVRNSNGLNDAGIGAKEVLKDASKGKLDDWRREQLQDAIDEGLVRAGIFGMQ